MEKTDSSGTWYLFDYGMVISAEPEPEDWAALERETGLRGLAAASGPYWNHRDDYDAGRHTPAQYWARVLGRPVGAEQLRALEELDAAQWAHVNADTLAVLETLSEEGARLALLSNMPASMADQYLREAAWPARFTRTFFSGPLGMSKPDPRIFTHVLDELGAVPADVVFIDDNVRNIGAARELGLHTVHFRPGTDLRQELARFRKRSGH
ncbi:HAD family phosphatase [Arthrobacter sp. APC 3897]|uniref:HAD family hydrolase n=1 Tax=Arthrobacter sp. APC 3897 TaxID=3035204 RepID=UPI0025B4F8F1|nr:HAD family phosphatase [Arthrobacter sp. APC 3897]MDN3480445.1 HAD family phosphatase [Arthrobacter sp. APC 3897]